MEVTGLPLACGAPGDHGPAGRCDEPRRQAAASSEDL